MTLALENIRVLDLSRIWAGPHATKLLADMGAEVIKVESTRAWDPHRTISGSGNLPGGEPGSDPWNRSGWFNTLHMSKYGVTADASTPEGRALIEELVAISDVVIENFRSGVMERRGLGYTRLRTIRPDVVVVSMPAFGNAGRWKDFIQYGIGQEQLAGIASLNGYEGDPRPMKSGVNFGDPLAGAHAAGAVLAALLFRRRSGRGMLIDLSQLDSAVCTVGEHLLGYQMTGRAPANRGNRHPRHAPHGAYRCRGRDAWVAIAVTTDEGWAKLCQAMGAPELARDPRFADAAGRRGHADEIDALVTGWTAQRDGHEVMQTLQALGVAATPVMSGERIFADPHYQARGLMELVDHPSTGPYFMPGVAWRMSRTPGRVRWPAPRLGEHNAFVYGALLGMAATTITGLEAAGVIGTTPQGAAARDG